MFNQKIRKTAVALMACFFLLPFSGCGKGWEVYTGVIEGGPVYSLEELYDAQAIARRDFLNIAYYNGDQEANQKAMKNFEPEEIGTLREEISLEIRESLAARYREEEDYSEVTAEDFTIVKYLGCYYDYYVFRYSSAFYLYPDWDVVNTQEVGEFIYHYRYSGKIMAWKKI